MIVSIPKNVSAVPSEKFKEALAEQNKRKIENRSDSGLCSLPFIRPDLKPVRHDPGLGCGYTSRAERREIMRRATSMRPYGLRECGDYKFENVIEPRGHR